MDEMVGWVWCAKRRRQLRRANFVKFCGFNYDTRAIPALCITEDKVSRGLALIDYLQRGTQGGLARLILASMVGVLQSLVPATPSNIGGSFLRGLYADLHSLEDPTLQGTKGYYFTSSSRLCAWWHHHRDLFPRSVAFHSI